MYRTAKKRTAVKRTAKKRTAKKRTYYPGQIVKVVRLSDDGDELSDEGDGWEYATVLSYGEEVRTYGKAMPDRICKH